MPTKPSIYEQAEKAVMSGDIEGVRNWLSSGGHVNDIIGYPEGFTALHIAAKAGNLEMVKFLLAHKADVRAQDEDYYEPKSIAEFAMWDERDSQKKAAYAAVIEEIEKEEKIRVRKFLREWDDVNSTARVTREEKKATPLPRSRWGNFKKGDRGDRSL